MKVAIIGSRNLTVENIGEYLPEGVTEIVSGGAVGIDTCAENYAKEHNIALKIFPPEYEKYGKFAPLKRNDLIIDYADLVIAFWDGISKGTKYVIDRCNAKGKKIEIHIK